MTREDRKLKDLRGIGERMLQDMDRLGIKSVAQLRNRNPQSMYHELGRISGKRQDPCVLDTFRCAVEQARNPNLPEEQRNWWYWSRVRKG